MLRLKHLLRQMEQHPDLAARVQGLAQAFWRDVIGRATGGRYEEVEVTEGWWRGVVQRFRIDEAASP